MAGTKKFSELSPGSQPSPSDYVVGIQGGQDVRFTVGQVTSGAAPSGVTSVGTGTGLTGGPVTSIGTVALANTTVTPGSYTRASITVDQQGRLTAASSGVPSRPLAAADTTWYVNADTGNDSNNGTSPGTPFKTQVKAWNAMAAIDGNGFSAVIQLQNATAEYDGINLDGGFGNVTTTPTGWASITFQGNASDVSTWGTVSPVNSVVVSGGTTPFGTCYSFSSAAIIPFITIQNMTLSSSGVVFDSGSVFVGAYCNVTVQNMYMRDIDLGLSCATAGVLSVFGVLFLYGVDITPGAYISADGLCTVFFEPSSVMAVPSVGILGEVGVTARNGAFIECFLPDMSALNSQYTYKFWIDSNAVLYTNPNFLTDFPGINTGAITNGGSIHSGPRITDPGWLNQICPSPVLDVLTVATLPTPCVNGSTAFVTDSVSNPTPLLPVVGGGSTFAPVIYLGNKWVYLAGLGRTVLQANLDLYVATTGSDTTGTGAIGSPFATPAFAVQYVAGRLDGNQFDVHLHIGAGTYTDQVNLLPPFGVRNYTVTGDVTTPANVVIKPHAVVGTQHSGFLIRNIKNTTLIVEGLTLDSTDVAFGGWAPVSAVESAFTIRQCVLKQPNNDDWYGMTLFNSTFCTSVDLVFDLPGTQTAAVQLDDKSSYNPIGGFTLTGSPAFDGATILVNGYSNVLWQPTVTGAATGITVALTNFASFVNQGDPVPGNTDATIDGTSAYNGQTGWSTHAGIPTTTEIPIHGTGGVWKDTSGGGVYLAYNDGGVIKKVALT